MMKFFFPFLFLFLFLEVAAQERGVVSLHQLQGSMHLAQKAIILEDPKHEFQVEDILLGKYNKEQVFLPLSEIPYLDFTSSTFWMIIDLENQDLIAKDYYIELARPLTNQIDLYLFNETDELIKVNHTGDDFQFEDRPYRNRKFIFPESFPAKSKTTIIVRATSDGEILKLPLKFWDVQEFTQFNSVENFFLGSYYGFLTLVFILFGFFAFAVRQKLYVYFIAYVLVLGIFQFALDGFAYQFLWPSSPWMGNHAILLFAAISVFALLLYADQFLEFYKLKGWFYKLYQVFYFLTTVGFILSFFQGIVYELTFPILNALSFLYMCFFFVGIYLKYKAGYQTDAPTAFAFVFLWLGAIFFILSNVNLIENEFLANNAIKIGSAAEITLLSLAMAGRYRKTQDQALARLKEINDLKSKQTEELERQVKERTLEISEKNIKLTEQNEEIINSINYAQRLQSALLPSQKMLDRLFKACSILYLPKDIVSGDFYWVDATETHTFFAVADCTGHGVPGAMVSVIGYNGLNKCVNELKLTEPGVILDHLRNIVEATFENEEKEVSDGMDICLCVWDNQKTLQFAGAFNSLYLLREEELIEIKGDKQPIGKFILKEPFKTHTIDLQNNDSVYLFSDGYPDQFGGPKGRKLKYSVFKEYLKEVNQIQVAEASKELEKKFHLWKADEEQVDDVCVLNVRF